MFQCQHPDGRRLPVSSMTLKGALVPVITICKSRIFSCKGSVVVTPIINDKWVSPSVVSEIAVSRLCTFNMDCSGGALTGGIGLASEGETSSAQGGVVCSGTLSSSIVLSSTGAGGAKASGIALSYFADLSSSVANNDFYMINEDTSLNGQNVQDNDSFTGTLTSLLLTRPSNAASFSLSGNGSFSYDPTANFNGTDEFTYQNKDSADGYGNVATVTIIVQPLNDPPIGSGNTVTTSENTPYTFAVVDFEFVDFDGDPLVSVRISSMFLNDGTLKLSGIDVSNNQVITVENIPNLIYTPPVTGTGSPFAFFTYTPNDGNGFGSSGTMFINVL